VSGLYAWLRKHPLWVDAVPAFLLWLAGLDTIVSGPLWLVPFTFGFAVPVWLRRRDPLRMFVIAMISGGVQLLVQLVLWRSMFDYPFQKLIGTDLAVVFVLYALAAYRPRRESVWGLAVCVFGGLIEILLWMFAFHAAAGTAQPNKLNRLIIGCIFFFGPMLIAWVFGDSMRVRRAYFVDLEDRAARLERERDAQAQIAAAAERARIARELHDVVAHNVSVMVVQADGASFAMENSPEAARAALGTIASTGRQALTEMRRLLGVLRNQDERSTYAPQPGIDQLDDLLTQVRDAGLAVEFTVDGVPRELPAGMALTVYRVVQESLTNTRKHGGASAHAKVGLHYGDDQLWVCVVDDGKGAAAPSDGAGHGLVGMRERVSLHGGELRLGPRPTGGFEVRASLPYRAEGGDPRDRNVVVPDPATTVPESDPLDPGSATESDPRRDRDRDRGPEQEQEQEQEHEPAVPAPETPPAPLAIESARDDADRQRRLADRASGGGEREPDGSQRTTTARSGAA
jgi:signal transduction histidine kinase